MLVPSDPLLRRFVAPIDAGAGAARRAQPGLGRDRARRRLRARPTTTSSRAPKTSKRRSATDASSRQRASARIRRPIWPCSSSTSATSPNMTMSHKRLRVGDVVLAIGNPFGHGNTVTMGIVSGAWTPARSVRVRGIHPDRRGDQRRQFRRRADRLERRPRRHQHRVHARAEGRGRRLRDSDRHGQERAQPDHLAGQGDSRLDRQPNTSTRPRQSPQPRRWESIVQGVYKDSPAAPAGLRAGDVLLRLNDEQIAGQLDLYNREASIPPGSKVQLAGLRDGKPFTIEVKLGERPLVRAEERHARTRSRPSTRRRGSADATWRRDRHRRGSRRTAARYYYTSAHFAARRCTPRWPGARRR